MILRGETTGLRIREVGIVMKLISNFISASAHGGLLIWGFNLPEFFFQNWTHLKELVDLLIIYF